MKQKFIFLSLAFSGLSSILSAQTFPLTYNNAVLDVGNIKATHLVHGDMWHDTAYTSPVEFPKGSAHHDAFNAALWMSGYTSTNTLRTAAVMYRTNGSDYWPGPVDNNATTPQQLYDTSKNWAKIWKIDRAAINGFRALSTHTISNTPAAILQWPAKGNPYARGAGSVLLSISGDMAPFVDVNADGQYNALSGDYPCMKGDQMLWWVINDAGPTRSVAGTNPLKMEIRISAYAFSRGTVADNIIFYEYNVTNKSQETYSRYRLGLMADYDFGLAFNDLAGFDSGRRLGIIYNHEMTSNPAQPRMGGIAIMELPGDTFKSYAPAGSFVAFPNGTSSIGDPTSGVEFDLMLRSSFRDGSAPSYARKYIPPTENFWCDMIIGGDDQRLVIASDDINFEPGQTKKFSFAMVMADSTGECPTMNFSRMNQTTDTAYKIYWDQQNASCGGAVVTGISKVQRASLRMYPNPANSMLYVETSYGTGGALQVYDAVGSLISLPQLIGTKGFILNVYSLPAGIYTIRYRSNSLLETGIFVKE